MSIAIPTTRPIVHPLHRGITNAPFAPAPAAGGEPFDPATLTWTAGRKRNWWHNNGSAGSLTTNSNGGGTVPGNGDPVGSIILTGTDCYTLSYGNSQGVKRPDGVEFPQGSYFIKSMSGIIRTTGFTVGAKFRKTSGSTLSSLNSFGGGDIAPAFNSFYLDYGIPDNGLRVVLDENAYVSHLPANDDYSVFRTAVATVYPISGTTMGVIMRLDGVVVATGTLTSTFAWDRDLPYFFGDSMTWESRFFAQQGFGTGDDLANIENFLNYGAAP